MLLDGQSEDSNDTADLEPLRDAAGAEAKADAPEPAVPAPPEPNKPVSLETPKSRRAQAEEKRNADFKALSDSVKEMRDGLTQRDRQIGELTGHLSALAQQRQAPPIQQYQQPPPQLPDPDALLEQANARLDARDMTGYHRLLLQANQAATMRAMAPVLQRVSQFQQQPAPQQQVPAELMAYFAAYPDVATHPKRDILLQAKNAELDARDFPAGPGRVRAVFEEVQATIKAMGGQRGQAPGFDRGSAAALSGVPTARPSGGSGQGKGEPRVEVTPAERKYWKAAGMNDEGELAKYIADAHPERVIR